MSFAGACKGKDHRHVVVQRWCNHSAFNGYRRTPSDYSEVRCIETRAVWRTKAAYVNDLPDIKPDDWRAMGINPLVVHGYEVP